MVFNTKGFVKSNLASCRFLHSQIVNMAGVGKSLLRASGSSLELSKADEGSGEISQLGLLAPQVMKETAVFEVGVSESFKGELGTGNALITGVFPNVISLDEILQCNFCDQAFFLQDLKSLQQHILELHYQGPKCSLCESMFASKDALKDHVRQRHVNEISTCEVCHMECQDLPFHMETFHKSESAPVKLPRQKNGSGVTRTCPECQKEISVDNFGRHVQEKHSKLRKSCPHCPKDFAPSNLQRHIRFASHQ